MKIAKNKSRRPGDVQPCYKNRMRGCSYRAALHLKFTSAPLDVKLPFMKKIMTGHPTDRHNRGVTTPIRRKTNDHRIASVPGVGL